MHHPLHAYFKNNRNSILYDSSGYNESESESIMANNESKYFPLTLEQEVIVTTCVTCLHTFTHAGASHLILKINMLTMGTIKGTHPPIAKIFWGLIICIFGRASQKAEAILNIFSNNINKTNTGLISVLQGFQKCIA